jgi:Cadherin-like beta sandwich domain
VNINVLSDPPVAHAGQDTTVAVETSIRLHAMGSDGFGPVVYREWKIGTGEFMRVPQQETSIPAPATPGDLECILRITDSDGLTALDTMIVKVAYNSNATLAGLRTTMGKLDPAFRKDIYAYSLALGATDSLLSIIPTIAEIHAKVSIDGVPGNAPVRVAPGENIFIVQVTAQDGSSLQYSVTARR